MQTFTTITCFLTCRGHGTLWCRLLNWLPLMWSYHLVPDLNRICKESNSLLPTFLFDWVDGHKRFAPNAYCSLTLRRSIPVRKDLVNSSSRSLARYHYFSQRRQSPTPGNLLLNAWPFVVPVKELILITVAVSFLLLWGRRSVMIRLLSCPGGGKWSPSKPVCVAQLLQEIAIFIVLYGTASKVGACIDTNSWSDFAFMLCQRELWCCIPSADHYSFMTQTLMV